MNKRTKNLQDIVDGFAKVLWGRTLSEAHKKNICVRCGEKLGPFKNDESRIEYGISGLCQACQTKCFEKKEK